MTRQIYIDINHQVYFQQFHFHLIFADKFLNQLSTISLYLIFTPNLHNQSLKIIYRGQTNWKKHFLDNKKDKTRKKPSRLR